MRQRKELAAIRFKNLEATRWTYTAIRSIDKERKKNVRLNHPRL